jgi:molecular chaperone HtpG
VLLMADRVDEWALNYLHDFDGTPLQSVASECGGPASSRMTDEKKAAEDAQTQFKPVLDRLKTALVTSSPMCEPTTRWWIPPPGGSDGDMSTQLARMLKQAGQTAPEVKLI